MFSLDPLLKRVFRPNRTRTANAIALVEDCVDPNDAWERLAANDMIPLTWITESQIRRFASPEPNVHFYSNTASYSLPP